MNARRTIFAACGLAVSALGCTVGSGSGAANGKMYIQGCEGYDSDPAMPSDFDLSPSFFAGEPVEDIRENDTQNRLTIRLQRYGGGFDVNDVLQFDIVNSYEVARCVRGRQTSDPVTNLPVPDYNTDICEQKGDVARLRVGPNDFVRSTLTAFGSCRANNAPLNLVATAVPCDLVNGKANCPGLPPEEWQSFIDFKIFGSERAGNRDVPPLERKPVGREFRVDFGEQIKVTNFVLNLVDDHFLVDPTGPSTPTVSAVHGTLSGNFDFEFERGRAVQTFP